MLYIYCGERYGAREYARAFADGCKKKSPNSEYIYFSSGFTEETLDDLLRRQGLFESKYIVFCNEVLSDSVCAKCIIENTKSYIDSQHMFIIFEPGLSTENEKYLTKKGAVIKKFHKKIKQEGSHDIFSFVNVFLNQNKQKTLGAFYKLLLKNESAENVLNIMLWQVRMLVLVSKTKNAEEAGVKPFVYTKSKKALDKIISPFDMLIFFERAVRNGRVNGLTNEEIVEYIIVAS